MRNSIVKFSYKDKTVSFTDKLKNFSTDKRKVPVYYRTNFKVIHT